MVGGPQSQLRAWRARRALESGWDRSLGPLLGQFLAAREMGDFDAYAKVDFSKLKSPFLILNMASAARRFADAITAKQNIALYADYDMDGMSGLAVLSSFLADLGVAHQRIQPERLEEGYGLHTRWIESLADQGTQLIITIDTGSTAVEAIDAARRRGMDVIVTDHHLVGPELPSTPFLCNPNQAGDSSGLGMLSGAGMAFYLAMATRKVLREQNYFESKPAPDLLRYLDFFALGTIADLVPLTSDNRILLRAALERIRHSRRPGIMALLTQCLKSFEVPTVRDIAFSVTPKLNAASRMGKPEIAMKLLLAGSVSGAWDALQEILSLNEQRSQIQKDIFSEAQKQASEQSDSAFIVVHGPWHEGVLGIIAAKLVEEYQKPSIVLSSTHAKARGSMRSVKGVHCVQALNSVSQLLERYGGHEMAAGLSLDRTQVESLRVALNDQAPNAAVEQEPIEFDGWILEPPSLSEVEKLYRAGPFGNGHPEPLFCVQGLDRAQFKTLGDLHIKMPWQERCQILGFGWQESLNQIADPLVDVLVTPEINRFRNSKSVQLRVCELRASQSQDLSSGSGRRLLDRGP
jgi:single-stranded-DNA-specific exonuclease